MCGRFYFDEETEKEIYRIVSEIDARINGRYYGDIHPSESAIIITGRNNKTVAEDMKWGFPVSQSKQLLINARSETALEKVTFSESVLRRRCIIPAKHFYEWDRSKNKVTFSLAGNTPLYMAGFYNCFSEGDRFVILTTRANESMSPVHDRMPLILSKEEIKDWIYDDSMMKDFLSKEVPMLNRTQDYEQLSLF